jgi:hypothetical protein
MTHIPQAQVLIIVPYYHWGRLVQRAYLDKLIEKYGEDNVESLQQRFVVITPRNVQMLRGWSDCLILLHREWRLGADFMQKREISHRLRMFMIDPRVEIQEIGEDYY